MHHTLDFNLSAEETGILVSALERHTIYLEEAHKRPMSQNPAWQARSAKRREARQARLDMLAILLDRLRATRAQLTKT